MPNIDRISNLPDELLTHILSFLETNYAVQTSVLSKRWEKLWVLVPNFSITYTGEDPSYETHRSRCISFKHSIHRALASRGSTDIHSFHLVYSSCLRGDLESFTNRCLTELFRRRVREVVMDFEVELELRANPIRLSVFSCETLVNLTLLFPKSLVTLPDTVWFPELKELEIWVTDPDDSFTEKLCSGCPVLKDFTLHIFTEDDSKDIVVNICLYALKGLELNFRSCPSRDYRVILDAPVLEDLRFEDSFLAIFEIRNLMSLQSVDIELGCSYENEDAYLEVEKVFDFLRGIANANYLRLPYNSMRELTHPDEDGVMSFGDTSFVNLKHLEVEVGCFKRLSVALAKMPNLEYLEITLKCDELDQFSVVPWQTPNLKIIEVHDVRGKKVVLQFLKYVLKNAALLEEMVIEFKLSREKQFEESLLNAPRSSAECEIEFSEEEFELDDDE